MSKSLLELIGSGAVSYPGDFWRDVQQTLAWLRALQSPSIGNWQGNALQTPTPSPFAECGITSVLDLTALGLAAVENIVIDPPEGIVPDDSGGPDGFPINYSPQGLPQGNLFLGVYVNSQTQTITGRCFSLLQPAAQYRVDIFSHTDVFYYKGSSSLVDLGGGMATWSFVNDAASTTIAVLYPTSVPQPGSGSYFSALPAGWVAHSNMGVGQKLANYKAIIYTKTDTEYLLEDPVNIIVQDSHHARAGSSAYAATSGILTFHILFDDPVKGYISEFTSLQHLSVAPGLPRNGSTPTSDPSYVADVTSEVAATQDRCWIYDAALLICAYAASGNIAAAQEIVAALNSFLDNPGYLISTTLEDAEDGLTSRWSASNTAGGDTITNINDPNEPPYGTGRVIDFHAGAAGDVFTWIGTGFPDAADSYIKFEHEESSSLPFNFKVGVTTNNGKVIEIDFTSDPAGAATYNSTTKVITVPIGLGGGNYRYVSQALQPLIAGLVAGETLSSITGFKVVLNAMGDLRFDNFSVGVIQPTGSLSYSYDVYNGDVADTYLRGGSIAWVAFAYCVYMALSGDWSPTLELQKILNYLLTLKSADADNRAGLYYTGNGFYQNPGYQFIPGPVKSISCPEQYDIYFAFSKAAKLLPTAAANLLKNGSITAAQNSSLLATASTMLTEAQNLATNILNKLYVPPASGLAAWVKTTAYTVGTKIADANGNVQHCLTAGTSGAAAPAWATALNGQTTDGTAAWELVALATQPGHFCSMGSDTTLDGYPAVDSSGVTGAAFAHEVADDTKATECLKYVYGTFLVSGATIALSGTTLLLAPPAAPTLSAVAGGTLPARTYYVTETYSAPSGETLESQEISIAIGANQLLHVASAAASGNANGWNVYASETTGEGTEQNGAAIALGTAWTEPTSGLTATGALQPSVRWNQEYQMLTPYTGVRYFQDVGAPQSVTQEETWEFISSLLRLYDVAAVQAYFNTVLGGTGTEGIDSLLNTLIAGQSNVRNATNQSANGNKADAGSLLGYSLPFRDLPWEFSVLPAAAGTCWFYLTATNPQMLDAIASIPRMLPFLVIPQGVEQSVNQLDATSSIGALELDVADVGSYASGLVSAGNLEGRKLALKVGYPGINSTDFVTVATQQIDHIDVLEGATGFKLQCKDLKRSAKTKIFLTGDDGQKISDKHLKTLSANPMDAALMVLQNELGVGQSDLLPRSAWKIYDPSQGGTTENPTLVYPNPYLDVDQFLAFRNDIFAGYIFDFTLSESVEAKQFLENEIFKVLGGYWITLADGRLSPRFFFPPYDFSNLASLNQRNIVGIPTVTRSPLINQVTFRLDYKGSGTGSTGSDFDTELNFAYAPSLEQYDLQGIQIIESKGLRSARGGQQIAALTANRIFRRYAGINPVTWKAAGGAAIYEVTSQFMTLGIEAADYIFLSHPLLPNFETGQRGIYNRPVEVTEKQPDYARGQMKYKLLDTGWLASKQLSKIAPDGTPAWPAASAGQRSEYMFLADSATEKYSDGAAGKTVW